jgi:hypothetical protein
LRIGNLVNPLYTVAAFIEKRWLADAQTIFAGAHDRLRSASPPVSDGNR